MGIVYIITLNVIIGISALLLRMYSAVSVNDPALNYVCFLQNGITTRQSSIGAQTSKKPISMPCGTFVKTHETDM